MFIKVFYRPFHVEKSEKYSLLNMEVIKGGSDFKFTI